MEEIIENIVEKMPHLRGGKQFIKTSKVGLVRLEHDGVIHTIEGDEKARKGDLLVLGVNGEIHPIEESKAEKKYVPAKIDREEFLRQLKNGIENYATTRRTLSDLKLKLEQFIPHDPLPEVKTLYKITKKTTVKSWRGDMKYDPKEDGPHAYYVIYGYGPHPNGKIELDHAIIKIDKKTGFPIGHKPI